MKNGERTSSKALRASVARRTKEIRKVEGAVDSPVVKMAKAKRIAILRSLQGLQDKRGAGVTPEKLVSVAKDPKHPAHKFIYNCTVNEAAHKWYLERARVLISGVLYKHETETRTVVCPYYIRDPSSKPNEQGYRSIVSLKEDEHDAHAAIAAEFARAGSHLRRARDLAIVLGFEGHIENLIENLEHISEEIRIGNGAPA